MTTTTIPVGSTGQLLEGLLVNGAVRESVVLADPETADAFAKVVSSQPINFYGLPVWMQGTPSVSVAALPAITGTVSLQGTSSVNVVSSAPHAIVGTVSTQIISSIPFFVAQSSAPWTMNGALAVTNSPNVNVTNVPAVTITSSIPFFVAQSSAPWSVHTKQALQALAPTSTNISTTSAQIAGSTAARKGMVITNMGSNNLSLAFGTTAVANMGMTLAPYGTFTMSEYDFTTTAVNAIATGTTTPVGVQEFQ